MAVLQEEHVDQGAATAGEDAGEEQRHVDHNGDKLGMTRAARERSRFWLRFGVLIAYGGIGVFMLARSYADDLRLDPTVLRYVGIGLVVAGATVAAKAALDKSRAVAAHYERRERVAVAAADKATEAISDPTDTLGLLHANQRQMEAYASIARAQAASSHLASQIAMGAGLFVLVLGGTVAYFVHDSATKAVIAVLTSIGTVVGGYISRTFITVQRAATEQMSFYFRQPLVQSYVLTAERLASQLDDGHRQDSLIKLIERLVEDTPGYWSTGESRPASRKGPR